MKQLDYFIEVSQNDIKNFSKLYVILYFLYDISSAPYKPKVPKCLPGRLLKFSMPGQLITACKVLTSVWLQYGGLVLHHNQNLLLFFYFPVFYNALPV